MIIEILIKKGWQVNARLVWQDDKQRLSFKINSDHITEYNHA